MTLAQQIRELMGRAKKYDFLVLPCEAGDIQDGLEWNVALACSLLLNNAETLAQAVEAMEWRPIETAPRDGRNLFVTTTGILRVDGFHSEQAVGSALRWKEAPVDRYTHWRPLPTPPSKEDQNDDAG